MQMLTITNILDKYNKLFRGVGKIKNCTYKIKLQENCNPVAEPPRKIPLGIE